MRIIVGRDYYDRAMAYGRDESVTFVRHRANVHDNIKGSGILQPSFGLNIEHIDFVNSSSWPGRWSHQQYITVKGDHAELITYYHKSVMAIVCGKIYTGFVFEGTLSARDHYFWSYDALQAWLASYRLKALDKDSHWQSDGFDLRNYFKVRDVRRESLAWLIENKIVILTYNKPNISNKQLWQINGDNLKDMQFYKVLDPFTIFQEIDMFLGGVLAFSGNPMVEITDNNIKVHKHGFDTKFSFRKPKET